jgi:glycosyltransferase involved in cell wall biosynthesis
LSAFYGLERKVNFKGFSENVAAIWQDHQVLMMPSRVEARGIAITEAMACGRAVVASAVGGIPDTVTDGETGILVAAPSVEEWVKSLERLWREREALPAWGENGRKRVLEFFASDVIQDLVDLLLGAAEGTRSAQHPTV